MRQPFLGKPEWERIDEKAAKKANKKEGKKGKIKEVVLKK